MNYTQIIDLLQKKDQSGLEALYNAYGAYLYNYACANWHLSEDDSWEVVYETLLKVVRVFDRYEFESDKHFQNWIFKIFKNDLLQQRRRRSKEIAQFQFISLDELKKEFAYIDWAEFSDSIGLIDEQALSELLQKAEPTNSALIALDRALQELSEEEKDLLLLRVQDFSYDQIAEFLGTDNSQLKVKHHRAKLKLLKLYNAIVKTIGNERTS